MNIVVFGYLGFQNFGDSLLLDATLRDCPDRSTVFVVLNGAEEEIISPRNAGRLNIKFVFSKSPGHFRAMMTADRVVCIGGTCFHRNHSGFLVNQKIALLFFKKIEWRNVGFETSYKPGPFKRGIFRKTVARMSVRDPESARIAVESLGIEPDFDPDAGFSYKSIDLGASAKLDRDISVVVSPRNAENWDDSRIKSVTSILANRKLARSETVILPAGPKDIELSSALAQKLDCAILIVDWIQQIAVLKSSQVVIAERLHHQVLGLAFDKEVFTIPYMEKNKTVVEAAGHRMNLLP